jgi:hypothetical protein
MNPHSDESLRQRAIHWNACVANIALHVLPEDAQCSPAQIKICISQLSQWWGELPSCIRLPSSSNAAMKASIVDLSFYVYCKLHYLALAPELRARLSRDIVDTCPYARYPLELDELAPIDFASLYESFRCSPNSAVEVNKWAHACRWYYRIRRPLRNETRPPMVSPNNPAIDGFRLALTAALKKAKLTAAFFTEGRKWVMGSTLPLGCRDDFMSKNPMEGLKTPLPTLFKEYVAKETRAASFALIETHPLRKWDELPSWVQDLWLLHYYGFEYDQRNDKEKDVFHRVYIVLWHQWETLKADAVSVDAIRYHLPALPGICALGGGKWGVFCEAKYWEVCENIPHALMNWIQHVKVNHQGMTEEKVPIWDVGIEV